MDNKIKHPLPSDVEIVVVVFMLLFRFVHFRLLLTCLLIVLYHSIYLTLFLPTFKIVLIDPPPQGKRSFTVVMIPPPGHELNALPVLTQDTYTYRVLYPG